jgi:dUTP pyrophosphatase
MYEDEVLELYNRSSNPKKLGLILANSVGVVDADYYNCEDNDGEILFSYYNIKPWDVTLKVGDKVGQGVFKKVLRPEVGLVVKEETRKGGHGSTGR